MKILGSDFDGTFTVGGVDAGKLEALRKWRLAGNKFGIISGRSKDFVNTIRCEIPDIEYDFLATCNGAYIVDGYGNLIYEKRCDNISLDNLIVDLFVWESKFVQIIGKEYVCVLQKNEDCPSFISPEKTCLRTEFEPVEYFNQISILLDSPQKTEIAVNNVLQKYGEVLTPLQNGMCIDIVPKGINKAEGLYRVMEHYLCTYDDVIAVGDNLNDIHMIREFYSYAMASGREELKTYANHIINNVSEIFTEEI